MRSMQQLLSCSIPNLVRGEGVKMPSWGLLMLYWKMASDHSNLAVPDQRHLPEIGKPDQPAPMAGESCPSPGNLHRQPGMGVTCGSKGGTAFLHTWEGERCC